MVTYVFIHRIPVVYKFLYSIVCECQYRKTKRYK